MANEDYVLTEMELDAIGEVMNISMGSAATAMSTIMDRKVSITTPNIKNIKVDEFDFEFLYPVIGVDIKYVEGIDGVNVLLLKKSDVAKIVGHLLSTDPEEMGELDDIGKSAICEIMNQMMGSAASALATFLGRSINISPPEILEAVNKDMVRELFEIKSDSLVSIKFDLHIEGLVDSEFLSAMEPKLAQEIVDISLGANGVDKNKTAEDAGASEPAATGTAATGAGTAAQDGSGAGAGAAAGAADGSGGGAGIGAVMAEGVGAGIGAGGDMSGGMGAGAVPGGETPGGTGVPSGGGAAAAAYGVPVQAAMAGQQAYPPPGAAQAAAGQAAMGAMGPIPPGGEQAAQGAYPYGQAAWPQAPGGAWAPPPGYPPYPYPGQMVGHQDRVATSPYAFKTFGAVPGADGQDNLDLVMTVPIQISVELGRTRRKIKDIADLGIGNIVELDRQAGDQVDVIANGKLIARGDVVVVDDNYSVRITEIIKQPEEFA